MQQHCCAMQLLSGCWRARIQLTFAPRRLQHTGHAHESWWNVALPQCCCIGLRHVT